MWNYFLKCVFKASEKLRFSFIASLISIVRRKCSTTKVCGQSKRDCFLIYLSSVSIIRLMFSHEKYGRLKQYCANLINDTSNLQDIVCYYVCLKRVRGCF